MRTPYIVLVVDDDNDIIDSISMVLESAGYNVITAETGATCLDIIQTNEPDILILDVMLDTLTEGLGVYTVIRSNPKYDEMPVVLISAIDHDIGFPIDFNGSGTDRFLEKPLDPDQLLEQLDKLIHKK